MPPPAWPWGDAMWRSAYRSLVVLGIASLLMSILVAVPNDAQGIFEAIEEASAWGILGCVAVFAFVALWNKPRILVPPRLRDEPGELQRWKQKRSARERR